MSESDSATDWRKLREFIAVDLEQSFILSWHAEGETLLIDVDLYLMPEHPFYEKPRPAEKVCIRPAIIEFPFCDGFAVDGKPDGSLPALAQSLGHGVIEGLRRHVDGRYEISGAFGTVFLSAERPLLKLKGR